MDTLTQSRRPRSDFNGRRHNAYTTDDASILGFVAKSGHLCEVNSGPGIISEVFEFWGALYADLGDGVLNVSQHTEFVQFAVTGLNHGEAHRVNTTYDTECERLSLGPRGVFCATYTSLTLDLFTIILLPLTEGVF